MLLILGNPRSIPEGPTSLTKSYNSEGGDVLQISGQSHARYPETLVADLFAKSKGDVLQIRAYRAQRSQGTLSLMTLLANTKVDVPVNLGGNPRSIPEETLGADLPLPPQIKSL